MSNFDLDLSDLQEELDRLKGNNNNILEKFVRMPKEGPITVRLLPPMPGKKLYCATRIHKLIMPDGRAMNIHCPRNLKMYNGQKRWFDDDQKLPCSICKYNSELWQKIEKAEREGNKELAEEIKKKASLVKANERYYYNCIVRQQINLKTGEIERNVGPKILSIPKTVHEKIVRAILGDPSQEEAPLGNVSDPKVGRDFKIMKRIKPGKDGYPEYGDSKFLDVSPLGDKDQIAKWLAEGHDLASLRRVKTHAEIKSYLDKYLGLIPLDEEPTNDSAVEEVESPVVVSATEDEVISDEEFLKELKNY